MELHSKILGKGPPIIILHGLLGTLDNWQTIANHLSNDYTVCLLDLRNHGKSPHSKEMDFHLMAGDVVEFMDSHWINSAIVMGHSMGGKVAMQLALDNSDAIEKLIVVDISAKKYTPHHNDVFEALDALDLKTLKQRKEAEEILNARLSDPSVVQFLLKDLTREKDGSFSWKMNYESIKKNYPKLIDGINGNEVFEKSTLFIRGSESDYIQDKDMELIKINFPLAELVTIEGAGHWVHADKPKELLEVVIEFLEKSKK